MANMSDSKLKNTAVSRYGWIVLCLFVVFVAIVVCIINIKYVDGDMWRKIGEKNTVKINREIIPNRGDVFSDDGRLLATSQPVYNIYLDFMADGIRQDTLMKYVTPLSTALANKFPRRTATAYKKILLDNWKLSRKELAQLDKYRRSGGKRPKVRTRYVRLVPGDITYLDLKELRTFPFLNQKSNKSGLIAEEKITRVKPFGNLAGRTVGSIYREADKGGASGIELKYDSIIRGVPGLSTRQHVQGRWIDVIVNEPQPGHDVKTTLNIEIQDMAERALHDKLSETEAESGCAIVMEVKTGEIKAIVNLDRMSNGNYGEGRPNAFSYMSEPGSTFKAVSLLVALEDGVVKPDDEFHVGDGVFEYKGRKVRDHYWRNGTRQEYMSVRYGMQISSNIVMAKMILKGYENNPKKYAKHIQKLGLTKKLEWDVPLQGIEGTSRIRMPDDKNNPWSKTTLPWMSFGYETQVPPIYMLMFYNGIANGGKMIKPFLTKSFSKDGSIEKEFSAQVVNSSLASRKTIRQVQEILREVVTEGTGKKIASDYFPIAGKTGTAQIADQGRYGGGHYISFCGYFPSDKPKYTCFVGIRKPKKGVLSGALMPGAVFKEIAEGIYFKDITDNPIKAPKDTLHQALPDVKNGFYTNTIKVLDELNLKYKYTTTSSSEWTQVGPVEDGINLSTLADVKSGLVPDVNKMGARDAIYLLENAGLRVNLIGAGRVTRQSLPVGQKVVKGATITIELK